MRTDIGTVLARLEQRLAAVERSNRMSSASLDDTALLVRNADGGLRALVGVQSDGTTAVNVVNGPPPPAPTSPTTAPALGGITAAWDGQFTANTPMPLDWSRVEVHASPLPVFTPLPATLQATIETPQGAGVYLPATGPLYVRLIARSTSGTPSAPTDIIGPTSPRPVEGDIGPGTITATLIADGAVTTPKVFANAITTALLAAGSVDAVALKADAITGKTITGGVINGSVMRTASSGSRVAINESGNDAVEIFDSADRLVAVIDGTGLRLIGSNSSLIGIDPDNTYPNLYLTSQDGSQRAVINVSSGLGVSDANIGINSGRFTASGFTDMKWRTWFGNDFWVTERVRHSDSGTVIGGRIQMDGTKSRLQFVNTETPAQTFSVDLQNNNEAQVNNGRVTIVPPASGNSACYVQAAAGHTGRLYRAQLGGVDRFQVNADGDVIAAGTVEAGTTDITTYTPSVTGAGTATYTTRTGWYARFGRLIFWNAALVVNAAGSGTGTVTVASPTAPDRTTRQICGISTEGVKLVGLFAEGHITALTTGSGAVWDRMSSQDNGATNRLTVIQGSHLLAGATIAIHGWYLEP
ncbi:hypothetical protein [Streptomyces sp. NPDC059076]|uniref:hypothetical protein n=1 Tax=unclassified Streptomyces TaxID=2593676 RepID=UPI00367D8DCF